MKEKLLKLRLSIALYTNGLDEFQDTVYLEMTDDTEDWILQAGKNAKGAEDCILKLFWESVCCATADSNPNLNVKVHIDVDCAEFEGHLDCQLLKKEDDYSKWTPKLTDYVKVIMKRLQHELSEMLCDMANSYYTGTAVKGVGEHYEYCLRY